MQKTTMPYEYQEYPRHLHHLERPTKVVTSDVECEAVLADGYTLQPGETPVAAPPQAKPLVVSASILRRGRRAGRWVDPAWPVVLLVVLLCLGWARWLL